VLALIKPGITERNRSIQENGRRSLFFLSLSRGGEKITTPIRRRDENIGNSMDGQNIIRKTLIGISEGIPVGASGIPVITLNFKGSKNVRKTARIPRTPITFVRIELDSFNTLFSSDIFLVFLVLLAGDISDHFIDFHPSL
jgi:hypothetical protein